MFVCSARYPPLAVLSAVPAVAGSRRAGHLGDPLELRSAIGDVLPRR